MAVSCTAFRDKSGALHFRPDQATLSDMAALLGCPAFGRRVFEARAEIEALFAEHDAMLGAAPDGSPGACPGA